MTNFPGLFEQWLKMDWNQAVLLHQTFQKNGDYKLESSSQNTGFDRQLITTLLGVLLGFGSLNLIAAAFLFRKEPAVFSFFILFLVLIIVSLYFAFTVFNDLSGEEDFKTIAHWPIRSQTYLFGKLIAPVKTITKMVLVLISPTCAVALFTMKPFFILGVGVWVSALFLTLSLVFWFGCLFPILIYTIGHRRFRTLMTLLFFGFWILSIFGSKGLTLQDIKAWSPPEWIPLSWFGHILLNPSLSTGFLVKLSLVVFMFAVLPFWIFRWTAHLLRKGITVQRSRTFSQRASRRWDFLIDFQKRKSDKVFWLLLRAHLRHNWRFQAQAMFSLGLLAVLVLGQGHQTSSFSLFSDPMSTEHFLNPSMLMMVLIMLPPVLALPLFSSSSDFQAAWILNLGQISETDYRQSVARAIRRLFTIPMLLIFTSGYLYNHSAPLKAVITHLLMLSILAELMTTLVQSLWNGAPFSWDGRDENLIERTLPLFMMFEVLSALTAILVLHIIYRWEWIYVSFSGLSLFFIFKVRRNPALLSFTRTSEPPEVLQEPEIPKSQPGWSPLITALTQGNLHTARILIEGGTDLKTCDEKGRTVREIALEMGFSDLATLIEAREKL